MDLEGIVPSEISQSKYHWVSLICIKIKKRNRHRQNKLVVVIGERKMRMGKTGKVDKRHKILIAK